MPPTWSDAETEVKCNEKFEELVTPILKSAEVPNEQSRFCGYIAFATDHTMRREVFSWASRDECKLVKSDGSKIYPSDLVDAGWQTMKIWECVNLKNIIKAI